MNRLEEIVKTLKTHIGESVEAALEYLEQVLNHDSMRYNDFIQIKSRYSSLQRELLLGVLDHSTYDISRNNISKALLLLAEEITEKDLAPEGGAKTDGEDKRGEVLYHIPEVMQHNREEKCTVRIAFTVEQLKRDWEESEEDVVKNIRISEIMAVALLNVDENDPPFAIRSFSETVQFLDKDDFTEWVFYVKPIKIGRFPLVLRVSVIEMINNKEYKKDIVLEEEITVQTDEVPPPGEAEFKSAGTSIALSQGPLPPVSAATEPVAKKAAQGVAGTLLKAAAMAAVATVALYFGYQQYQENQETKAWGNAKNRGGIKDYEEYLAKHPDGAHNEEAISIIDSLKSLAGDTLGISSPDAQIPPGTTSETTTSDAASTQTQGDASSSGAKAIPESKDKTGANNSAASLPSTNTNRPSSRNGRTRPSSPPAKPTEVLRGQHYFFDFERFPIVNSDGQFMEFRFFQYNQYQEVLVIVSNVGSIQLDLGMSVVLVPEKGKPVTAELKYVGFTKVDNRYDGYFAISPGELGRLGKERFKTLRLLNAKQQHIRAFKMTSSGSKDLQRNAEKAIELLNSRN